MLHQGIRATMNIKAILIHGKTAGALHEKHLRTEQQNIIPIIGSWTLEWILDMIPDMTQDQGHRSVE